MTKPGSASPEENINQRSDLAERQELNKEAEIRFCKYMGKQKANKGKVEGNSILRRPLR